VTGGVAAQAWVPLKARVLLLAQAVMPARKVLAKPPAVRPSWLSSTGVSSAQAAAVVVWARKRSVRV